ncbi:YveK family protein [Halobacillus faecis]
MEQSLRDVLYLLKKNLGLIIFTTVIFILATGVISYYIVQPTYTATSQFIVNSKPDQNSMQYSVNDIQTNVELINTYNVVIKSPAILDNVRSELNLSQTPEELSNRLDVSNAENSQVVAVTVTGHSQEEAAKIANKTVDVFKSEITKLMNVDNVHVLSPARIENDPTPTNLNPVLQMVIGSFLGLGFGIGLTLIKEYMNRTIRTRKDLEINIDIPVVGVISTIKNKKMKEDISNVGADRRGDKINVKEKKRIG